jgi:glycine/D-amino acid oxidase-like deaminating enzyme
VSAVVVVGAGIVGTATAWELARRGTAVVLVDRGEVSSGTTGLGEGNVLCSDKDAGPELELTLAGRALYAELEALIGPEARIRRKGALIVHPDARTWAAEPARVARLVDAGVEAELLAPDAVRAREPQLTGALHGATFVPGDLQCDPRAIARALARRATVAGAQLRTHAPVEGIVVEGGRARAVALAGGERLEADAVVLAAGPWSGPLAHRAGLALPLEPRKGQLIRLRLPEPDETFLQHKLVDGSYLLSVASTAAGRQVSSVIETTWDGDVLAGSSRERCGFDPSVDDRLAAAIQERAATLVPALAGLARAATWVGFRPWLPDHLPAIGPSRRVPGLWVATGHEGAGVALGPISGRLIAQALSGEPTDVALTPFDPDRFAGPE